MTRALPALLFLAAASAGASDFTFDIETPNVRVTLPKVPAMKLEPHPMRAGRPHLRLMGSEGPFNLSVLTPTAEAGMTAHECARWTMGELPKRPGVPKQDLIHKARINELTFVAIYGSVSDGAPLMHAHFISAAGGTHCVEVHVSKTVAGADEVESWFRGWGTARIDPR